MFLQFLDKIVSSPTLLIGTFLVVSFMIGGIRHWLLDHSLRDRQQFTDEEFGKTFFSGSERSADIAVQIREILSENLEMPLDGIRPEDKLDEDLNAQLEANPHLFWSLEEKYGFDAKVEDLEEFEKTVAGITTFSDLVKYVERKIDEKPKKGKKRRGKYEIDPDDRTSDYIGAMWFGGLILTFAGAVFRIKILSSIGLTIAFLPLAIGAFYMCTFVIKEFASEIGQGGWKVLQEHPFGTLFLLVQLALYATVGAWFSRGILSIWFGEG
jgi:acyl carrier protein